MVGVVRLVYLHPPVCKKSALRQMLLILHVRPIACERQSWSFKAALKPEPGSQYAAFPGVSTPCGNGVSTVGRKQASQEQARAKKCQTHCEEMPKALFLRERKEINKHGDKPRLANIFRSCVRIAASFLPQQLRLARHHSLPRTSF